MTTGESVSVNSQPICFSVHSDECGLLCNFFLCSHWETRSALTSPSPRRARRTENVHSMMHAREGCDEGVKETVLMRS